MEYKVQILNDKEFENLPFPETETSFGIADPETNTAYVRYSPNKDVMNYLVNHEVEHLIEGSGGKHSDHYRNGVYYKGLFDIFGGGGQQQAPPQGGLMSKLGSAAYGAASKAPGFDPSKLGPQGGGMMQGGGMGAPPNVSAGGGGSSAGGETGGMGGDIVSRLKGFFSGRPSGGF